MIVSINRGTPIKTYTHTHQDIVVLVRTPKRNPPLCMFTHVPYVKNIYVYTHRLAEHLGRKEE